MISSRLTGSDLLQALWLCSLRKLVWSRWKSGTWYLLSGPLKTVAMDAVGLNKMTQ